MNKQVISYILLTIFTLIFIEIACLTILICNDLLKNNTLSKSISYRLSEISQAWKPLTIYGIYDPVTIVTHKPNSKYGGKLDINEFGFISNSKNKKIIFPNKEDNITRIILLGGSSVAGSGVNENKFTFPSILENNLNIYYSGKLDKKYQVLNFGIGGGFSGNNFIKFTQYLYYLNPDIVISFTGFNDAWNTTFEHKDRNLDSPVINWADFSYNYYELLNGLGKKGKDKPLKFLTFTHVVFHKVFNKFKNKFNLQKIYEEVPVYKISEYFYNEANSSLLKTNLSLMSSISCFEKFHYYAILQPILSTEKIITDEEKQNLINFENHYNQTIINLDNYNDKMKRKFKEYTQDFEELEIKYRNCNNVNFKNFKDIFKHKQKSTFVDNVHLTKYGNEIIADKLTEIIINEYNK